MTAAFRTTKQMEARRLNAIDPGASAWVTANAGSGKTHVLTQRVLRLLVEGVPPSGLLCLTYTRAAAAEMRRRVAGELGAWALRDDAQLIVALGELGVDQPDADRLSFARRLFAQALDTPGGLRINTIHAFCESILHRFPLEAGVPFDFTVIEDAEREAMIAGAREAVLVEGLDGDGTLADAVGALMEAASDFSISEALDSALKLGPRLRLALEDPAVASANLRRALGLGDTDTVAAIAADIVGNAVIAPSEYASLAAHLAASGGLKRLIDKLAVAAAEPVSADTIIAAFLTKNDRRAPADLNVKTSTRDSEPKLADRIVAETERVAALAPRLAAARCAENSAALATVLAGILARYDRGKRARALVDFDDLVGAVRRLLDTSPEKWVAYRLDAQIDHILVDESQDTNPEQWAIVSLLADEFFAGAGVERATRTIFAVGDEKQSIYSFQGAEPHLFAETGREFRRRADLIGHRWHDEELKASFRALAPVLAGVDAVFEHAEAHTGLERPPRRTAHEAARTGKGGFIEIWPLVERPEATEPGDDYRSEPEDLTAAERTLAERIAGEIEEWITSGRRLSGTERAVTPGDVLILVQNRAALFHEIVAALKRHRLPNAGADKLAVAGHIAIEDLMVLGDLMANTADELALASVLRSPLVGISEHQLEELCVGRGGARLWPRLKDMGGRGGWAADAWGRLSGWRARLDLERPYDFFARILYAEGGLQRFHARLGGEVDDVIAEFLDMALDHERRDQPSLQGFLAELRGAGREVKRELSVPAGVVRVMTVHGAKGLEAPIVILADAAGKPSGRQVQRPVIVHADRTDPTDRLLALTTGAGPSPGLDALKQAERDAEAEEYHRRLYVGMTRPCAELVVAGVVPAKSAGSGSGSWYDLVRVGLADKSREIPDRFRGRSSLIFPADAKLPGTAKKATPASAEPLPDWLERPAEQAIPAAVLEPSGAAVAAPEGGAGADAEFARLRGTAIHNLLQFLPDFAPDRRTAKAAEALPALLPGYPQAYDEITESACRVLDDAALRHLFGSDSRAEVSVSAILLRNGTEYRLAGRIDRLVAGPPLLIVDFKSGAKPETVPDQYVTQLALYRLVVARVFDEADVRAAIVWTDSRALTPLDPAQLIDASRQFTLR